MKNIILVLLFAVSVVSLAQVPQGITYQAVIRNTSNNLVISSPVNMKISIISGMPTSPAVYTETQAATTNQNGLVTFIIGAGIPSVGTFSTINWANGPYYISTGTDATGGNNYNIVATTQLMSVPYALFAGNVKTYTTSTGVSISGSTITNTLPDKTVTINGIGISNVTGIYPNFTVNTPATNLIGTGTASVSGTFPNYTVNVPFVTILPQSSLTASGIASITTIGTNSFNVNVPAPILSLNGNFIGITGGNTLALPINNATVITSGVLTSSVSGNSFTLSSPAQTVQPDPIISITNNTLLTVGSRTASIPTQTTAVSLQGNGISTVSGSMPNFTVSTAAYVAGSGISVSGNTIVNTSPNQTVNLYSGSGTSVTGAYPNYTVSASNKTIFGSNTGGFTPSLASGSGFSAARVGQGLYSVTFTNAFTSAPSIISSVYYTNISQGGSNTTYFCKIYNISNAGFNVHLFNNSGDDDSIGFSIIATGN